MTDLPLIPLPPSDSPEPGFVVLGRFQPFHNGHAAMIINAEEYRLENFPELKLIIAVGSSNRPQTLKNPWSESERMEMILYWLDNEANIDAKIVSIPDIEDPPNWVSHAERYHGESGVFFSSDLTSSELYESSKWPVISMPLVERERFEGWRVRETARMLSTINDDNAIKMILGQSVPETIIDFLISNDCLKRLAFLGEGGEPVG
ncbi:MAG: adenylyltransferase/cytidyltransferase family protein [Candidatus Thalassarchaeaceae archaeon]|jgi:nicotinamide-nucleotide adenylyltransferase|nr:adenylyltransferase/cytidyltransferase family protein [Candidatus Thalassarchaeaceae archaeon]